MKVGFNLKALENIGNCVIIKHNKHGIKNVDFLKGASDIFKELRNNNHESYVFIVDDSKKSFDQKKKLRNKILKKYSLDKKYAPRIVVTSKEEYEDVIKRNGISFTIDTSKSLGDLKVEINEKIKELSEPIIKKDTPTTGVPSKDEFWKKYHTKESYKLDGDFKSPYDRITSGNLDFLDEVFLESSEFKTKMTYAEVFEEADKLCRTFISAGVKEGAKVPLVLASTPETFITILALFKAKATIVPLYAKSTENEIKAKLENVDYDYMVINDIFYDSVKNVIKDNSKAIVISPAHSASMIKRVYFNKILKPKLGCSEVNYNEQFIEYGDFIKNYPKYEGNIDTSYDPNYEAVQLFTGGTVKSKGVILTARNLEAAFQGYPISEIPVMRDDKFACFLPINHVFGLVSIIYSASAHGGKLSTILKIDFNKMDKMFVDDKITVFAGVPTMVDSILNNKRIKSSDLKQLRYFILGGAKTVEQVKKNVQQFGEEHGCDNLKVVDGIGQTEISTGYIYNNVLSINDRVKIVCPETGKELGYNEIGEICVTGPNVMKGYCNEEDNLSALEKDEFGNIWFHTGDLGYNKDGKIYHTGRLNRRIKVNGELIFVEDLEEVISKFDAIKDCCVVGKPDLKKGCTPVVFITLKDGYKYDETTKAKLDKFYIDNIAPYARPTITTYLSELPKTTVGKPDFKQLQLLADCMDNQISQKVKKI